MSIGDRIGRSWRSVALLGVGLAGGAAAVAVATVPDSAGVIHACVSATVADSGNFAGQTEPITAAPNVTVIDPAAAQACSGQDESIAWNVTGPQGPPGQNGAQGPPGKTGSTGSGVIYNLVAPTIRTNAPGIGTATIAGLGSFPLLGETTVSGRATGRGSGQGFELSLSKAVDTTSPRLHEAVASGRHFASATIVLYRVSGVRRGTVRRPGVVLKLREVVISSVQISASQSGVSPLETLTLSFGTLAKIAS